MNIRKLECGQAVLAIGQENSISDNKEKLKKCFDCYKFIDCKHSQKFLKSIMRQQKNIIFLEKDKTMNENELKTIANEILQEHNINDIDINFKNVKRGMAYKLDKKITIPKWIFKYNSAFSLYYMLHEISHIIGFKKFDYRIGHNIEFKKIETELLNRYNLKPIYARAYVKTLYNTKTNKIVFSRYNISKYKRIKQNEKI